MIGPWLISLCKKKKHQQTLRGNHFKLKYVHQDALKSKNLKVKLCKKNVQMKNQHIVMLINTELNKPSPDQEQQKTLPEEPGCFLEEWRRST